MVRGFGNQGGAKSGNWKITIAEVSFEQI